MAIHYYDEFPTRFRSRNFGDDINPFLLSRLFCNSVLESKDVCILGIGSILNRRNAEFVKSFKSKVVFSSGAGYGENISELDDSWDIACVRGVHTARLMGLPEVSGICDGAILLSDYYEPKRSRQRRGVVFIPHIKTHFSAGTALSSICSKLAWRYLTPDVEMNDFIEGVRSARLVITEAMHGAILADTMRVPWIPVSIHQHNDFKWRDWFSSISETYVCNDVFPKIWNPADKKIQCNLKKPYQLWKSKRVEKSLLSILNASEILSREEVLENRKQRLRKIVSDINERYRDCASL